MSSPVTQESSLQVTTHDGVQVHVLKVEPVHVRRGAQLPPVFMTHAMFSDLRICLGLARHLASQHGRIWWLLEWRGHGRSGGSPADDLDTVACGDVAAVLDALSAEHGSPHPFDAVTHSGGGLALLMCLNRQPWRRASLRRWVAVACQADDAAAHGWAQLRLRFLRWLGRRRTLLSGPAWRLGPEDEPAALLDRWFEWNLTGSFRGADGFDHEAAGRSLHARMLAVAGSHDRIISPPRACRAFLEKVGGADSAWLLAGRASGSSREHGHADVLHSRAAAAHVWPRIADWLAEDDEPRHMAVTRGYAAVP